MKDAISFIQQGMHVLISALLTFYFYLMKKYKQVTQYFGSIKNRRKCDVFLKLCSGITATYAPIKKCLQSQIRLGPRYVFVRFWHCSEKMTWKLSISLSFRSVEILEFQWLISLIILNEIRTIFPILDSFILQSIFSIKIRFTHLQNLRG